MTEYYEDALNYLPDNCHYNPETDMIDVYDHGGFLVRSEPVTAYERDNEYPVFKSGFRTPSTYPLEYDYNEKMAYEDFKNKVNNLEEMQAALEWEHYKMKRELAELQYPTDEQVINRHLKEHHILVERRPNNGLNI